AHARIRVEHASAMTLPAAAVLTADAQTYCYCVENGRARHTPVKVGARDGDRVEVLKKMRKPARPGQEEVWEDFTGTEAIVATNPRALADGQAVSVAPSAP